MVLMSYCMQPIPQLFTDSPDWENHFRTLLPNPIACSIWISGGSDSMLLAVLVLTYRYQQGRNPDLISFLHCNHQIRPESDREAKLLSTRLQKYKHRIFLKPSQIATSEEELRTRRYEQLQLWCKEFESQVLLLGHNLTDRIEGTLLNLLRGCGLNGVLGMQTSSSHHLLSDIQLFRPLLHLSKPQIQSLCQQFQIPFFEDPSNDDPKVSLRNRLRKDFLFPLSDLALQTSPRNTFFASREQVYAELESLLAQHRSLLPLKPSPYRNAKTALQWLHPDLSQVTLTELAQLFSALHMPLQQWELSQWQQRLTTSTEGFRQYADRTFFLSHGKGILIQNPTRFREKTLILEKKIETWWLQNFGLFWLEIPETLKGVTLRFPRDGDRFHWKSLTKWANNHKIPLFRRNALPLAEQEGKIIMIFKPEQLFF